MARSARTRTVLIGGGLVAAASAGALVTALALGGGDPEPGPDGTLGRTQNVALARFDDCDALLSYYRDNAARLVGPYGLDSVAYPGMAESRAVADGGGDAAAGSAAQAPSAQSGASDKGATSDTGTNVQVAGVDEADVAKLSGDLLLTLSQTLGRLQVSRVAGERVQPAGRLDTRDWAPSQLLVDGDRVLLVGSTAGAVPDGGRIADLPGTAMKVQTRLAEVDISDPAEPRLVRTLDIDGSVQGARLVDGVVRLAVSSPPPMLAWKSPEGDDEDDMRRATEQNRALVRKAGLDAWLPGWTLTSYDSGGNAGERETGRLADCDRVSSPRDFAGLETLSLVGFELRGDGLTAPTASAVVASGGTVYATATSTYVATSAWQAGPGGFSGIRRQGGGDRTLVHQFATDGADSRWVASGEVPGRVLNQFALDEFGGVLRVATTTDAGGGAMPVDPGIGDGSVSSSDVRPSPAPAVSSSQVTVLQRSGDVLRRVGSVGGLGKTEQIRSVRFIGDLGYVVTFRQTDPLYTIDLSDPRRPRAVGELKIPGYSGYLHPAGPGRLIGVGQDGDEGGTLRGMQISLFDIADPSAPQRIDAEGIPGAMGSAEGDHHAFTLSGDLLLSPFENWGDGSGRYDSGVLALRVRQDGLSEPTALRVADPLSLSGPPEAQYQLRAQRTFVRDGAIYTVTDAGIGVHDAESLQRLGFSRF